ncbi:MAG: electron transfer flavoprotein subunit alpha/FixB family protein [Acidobacteriota bacterium]
MSNDILVVIEHEDGKIRRGSFEALGAARQLAAKTGGRTVAALLGEGVDALAGEVAQRGADVVHQLEHAQLAAFTPDAYKQTLASVISSLQPDWVLMSHTYQAQDMLPLVAASFNAPVISDCVAIELEGPKPVFLRQPYDAKLVARTVDNGPAPHFATLQSGAFTVDGLPAAHNGSVEKQSAAIDAAKLRRKVSEIRAAGTKTVDLSSAGVIVAGGRGLGSKEKFHALVFGLANTLGAAVGASRPVVDSEWLPHEHQIGSSGQVVAPRLYVALGISGAIQHCVGMRGAGTVVAINKDPQAPIFNEATYGIVGDLNELVPALIKAVEEAKGA